MADEKRVKEILKELSRAIQESIAASARVAESVDRMRDSGYDLFLVLQATVALRKKQEDEAAGSSASESEDEGTSATADASFTGADLEFFRELRVRLD